jgi:hypothetical protein
MVMIAKLISGGQPGVERAALDLALELGIPCGGWCTQGRIAEDGIIPERYPLNEIPQGAYRACTRRNVEEAKTTLVLCWSRVAAGSLFTIRFCQWLQKLVGIVDLSKTDTRDLSVLQVREMLDDLNWPSLQVTGPRESEVPGISKEAMGFLRDVLVSNTPANFAPLVSPAAEEPVLELERNYWTSDP